jgi:hypothetical protein
MPKDNGSIPSLPQLQDYYERELKSLNQFLSKTVGIWRDEVLNFYPHTIECYKDSWLNDLADLSTEQEWKVDCGQDSENLPNGELREIFKEIQSLENIERWPTPPPKAYPSWALNKVGGKKHHEISRIIPLTNILGLSSSNQFVDIGGGKGHLSRIMCLYHGHNAISLDSNAYFQKLGKERLEKYPAPVGAGNLKFCHHIFGDQNQELKEREIFEAAEASIGLHTCGPLSLHHISKMALGKGLLNFPCCYQLLTPDIETHLSSTSKEHSLPIGKYALTLATRGHTTITFKDYLLKKKVKLMRAALHFYLLERHQHEEFTTVGPAHPRDYEKDFAHYAGIKLKFLGHQSDPVDLNAFYDSEETQKKIYDVYKANIIRWRWGRLIEKYLVFDRALAQVEKGFPVEVYQFFDEKISPRNLGLLLRKKKDPQ